MHNETPLTRVNYKLIWAGCIGNFLEFYNFGVYAFFAPMIAAACFPANEELSGLLAAILAFSAGFIARPAGAILFGWYGRKHGNIATLTLTMMVMATGSAIIALTPPHTLIGIGAPLLILLGRLMQGLAEGGEIGPATDFLYHLADGRRSGALGALQYATQIAASLAAVLIGVTASAALPHATLYAWGWRASLIAGLLIAPFGLWLRRQAFEQPRRVILPPPSSDHLDWINVTLVFLTIAAGTIVAYIRVFGVSYAISVLHLPPSVGMAGGACGMALALLGIALVFRASIRVNLLYILLPCAMIYMFLIFPAYALAVHHAGLTTQILLSTTQYMIPAISNLAIYAIMLHSLPSYARAGVFGVVYTLAVSLFGSATMPCIVWLLHHTHDPMVPAYIALCVFPIGIIAPLILGLRTGLISKRSIKKW